MAIAKIRKLGAVTLKCLAFFAAWLALVVIPVPRLENAALNRLVLEAKPLLCVAAVTVGFLLIDRKTTSVALVKRPLFDALSGLIAGGVWTFASIGIMFALGGMAVLSRNAVPAFAVWVLAMFLNAAMQEILLLVKTGSLAAPIMAHGIWNIVGALVFGAVSVADDYPQIYAAEFNGGSLISGGVGMLEGSVVTTVTSLAVIFTLILWGRQKSPK